VPTTKNTDKKQIKHHQRPPEKIAKPYGVLKNAFALSCNVRLFSGVLPQNLLKLNAASQ